MRAETFESDRLVMRMQRLDDADALFEAYSDERLMRFWSSAPHASVAETRAYLAPRVDDPDWRGWVVTLKGSDRPIGAIATAERRSGVAEIGYVLLRRHWGRGYAREAMAALLDRLFGGEGMRRAFADTDPENSGSTSLLEKLGFVREGLLRAEWDTHIGIRDAAIYGILASDWAERRARAPA